MLKEKSQKETQEVLFETRSVEVQEIIGHVPNWILRWGISVVGIIIGALILMSFFIKYPNKVPSRVTITSSNPPIKIISQVSGRISHLQVNQHDSVTEGSALLIIENGAKYDDVYKAGNVVKRLIKGDAIDSKEFIDNNSVFQLGELQGPYESLTATVTNYHYYCKSNQNHLNIVQLTNQLEQAKNLTKQLIQNSAKVKETYEIDRKKYETDTFLFSKGVITNADYLNSKKAWLTQELAADANQNKIVSSQLSEQHLQKEILDTKGAFEKENFDMIQNIKMSAKEFLRQVEDWDQKYVVRSPVSGRVNLFSYWKETQWVTAGEGIMIITPSYQSTVAKGVVSISNSGKLKIGQKVVLNLISHPSSEFGHVNGVISFVSSVPMDSVYSFDIELPQGLETSAGKKVISKPQLFAEGEIITENKTVASILLESFLGTN